MTNIILISILKKEVSRIIDKSALILRLIGTINMCQTICKHLEESIWTSQEVMANG